MSVVISGTVMTEAMARSGLEDHQTTRELPPIGSTGLRNLGADAGRKLVVGLVTNRLTKSRYLATALMHAHHQRCPRRTSGNS